MTIAQALKRAKRVYFHFGCANGANISFKATKSQVREVARPNRLDEVYGQGEEGDETASWHLRDGNLHIVFAT